MKKILIILMSILSITVFCSFSKSPVTVIGSIQSFGAEPLNYPGIVTEKNKVYMIIASDETKEELMKRQGKRIQFTGRIIKKDSETGLKYLDDGAFVIEYWEVIPL